jgi:hypothetical protein
MWRCLLRVLCPVRRPITTQDCALLKDISVVLAAIWGPEINTWCCLRVAASPRNRIKCCQSNQHCILLLVLCRETPTDGSCPTEWWAEPSLGRSSAISFPRIPECPGTQKSPTGWLVEISNALWHCRTKAKQTVKISISFSSPSQHTKILTHFSKCSALMADPSGRAG